jgi:hypothetical protein
MFWLWTIHGSPARGTEGDDQCFFKLLDPFGYPRDLLGVFKIFVPLLRGMAGETFEVLVVVSPEGLATRAVRDESHLTWYQVPVLTDSPPPARTGPLIVRCAQAKASLKKQASDLSCVCNTCYLLPTVCTHDVLFIQRKAYIGSFVNKMR